MSFVPSAAAGSASSRRRARRRDSGTSDTGRPRARRPSAASRPRPRGARRPRPPSRSRRRRGGRARRSSRRGGTPAACCAASNHTVRCVPALMWPCQHIGGVRTRSPSSISQRRPLTMVIAPSARVAKRIADAVCRCGTAWSPGSRIVKAPIRLAVVTVAPPNAGLAR